MCVNNGVDFIGKSQRLDRSFDEARVIASIKVETYGGYE